jgi:hypothetical protein
VTGLQQGVYALARTRRRRILWCAWWTAMPSAEPFVPPDAWGGGASDEVEAHLAAEAAAGMPLRQIEARWAGAWVRVRAGLSPLVSPGEAPRPAMPRPQGAHAILGIAPGADGGKIKAAFRQRALDTHPDRGGSDADFIAVKRAFDAIMRKQRR